DEVVVDDRVGVLLRVGDPHQHVDLPGQTGGDGPVLRLHRVEVRQVQQDDGARAGGEVAGAVAAVLDLEPVEQLLGTGRIPHRGQRGGGGGTAGGGPAQVFAHHRVEQGGLARTGGTEETDDGVLAGQGAAFRGGVRHPRQVGVLGGGEEALAQVGGLPQGLQAFGEAQFLP